ncbi:MAG: hypothetical protein NVS9B7_02160 [Flavisolibacter sp.]
MGGDASTTTADKEVAFLGSYGKQILIIVSVDQFPFISDEDLAFLTSVLSACAMSLSDIALVNVKNMKNDLPSVLQNMDPSAIVSLGIEPLVMGLPFHFPTFQLQKFNNRTYLYAPSLAEIADSKPLKGKLWISLKQLFNL